MQGVEPTHPQILGHLMHDTHGTRWTLEKNNLFIEKKARTYKNLQLYSWFILELKMLGRRNLYLNHPGMSLHTNFKVLGRLPEFLIPKMTSTQLCSETNSTSLPTGLLCTENIKSSTDKFDPKSLLNLIKFSTIRRTFSRAFFSY